MKRLAIVLQMGRAIGPGLPAALSSCYVPLLEAFRDHPAIRVHLQLSGDFLTGVSWYPSDLLDLVRAGIRAGRFEVLASTFSSAALSSLPVVTAQLQIECHLQLLAELFCTRPTGCLLIDHGIPEDHGRIFSGSGIDYVIRLDRAANPVLPAKSRETVAGSPFAAGVRVFGSPLDHRVIDGLCFPADPRQETSDLPPELRVEVSTSSPPTDPDAELPVVLSLTPGLDLGVERSILTGDLAPLEESLARIQEGSTAIALILAESTGLLAYERGFSPISQHENVQKLLRWIERLQGWETILLGESSVKGRPPGSVAVSSLAPGRVASTEPRSGSRSPESEGTGEAFPRKDQTVDRYRSAFGEVGDELSRRLSTLGLPLTGGARQLVIRALRTFASCQHRFGFPEADRTDQSSWDLVGSSLLIAEAARRAQILVPGDSDQPVSVEDLDRDGLNEIYLQCGRDLLIISPIGGRALYWIDLLTGEVIGGVAASHGLCGPIVSPAHPYLGEIIVPSVWSAAEPLRSVDLPVDEAWFVRAGLDRSWAAGLDTIRIDALVNPPGQRRISALRRVGLFTDEVGDTLQTGTLGYQLGPSWVRFYTTYGPKTMTVRHGVLTVEYPHEFGLGEPVTVYVELMPGRPVRPSSSAPPLRLEAQDKPLSVSVEPTPQPNFLTWQETFQSSIGSLMYTPDGVDALPPIRVELQRHP